MFYRNDEWKFCNNLYVRVIALQKVLMASEADCFYAVELVPWLCISLEEQIKTTYSHVSSVTELGKSVMRSGL